MGAVLIAVAAYLAVAVILMVIVARVTRDELETAWMIVWPLTLPVILIAHIADWLCEQ